MAVPAYVARAFRMGYRLMQRAEYGKLNRDPHDRVASQRDFVKRFQIAVRLHFSLALREHVRGNPDRAIQRADKAGRYFGEYRVHSRHLRSLPDYRPTAIYANATR